MSKPSGNRRLRVLMVADVSPVQRAGGSARVIKEQTIRLVARHHSLELLCRHPLEEVAPREELAGAALIHYPVNRSNPLSYAASSILGARKLFDRLLSDETRDVVVFHQPFSSWGSLSVGARVPSCVYMFYSPSGIEYGLRRPSKSTGQPRIGARIVGRLMTLMERRVLDRCSRVIVLSAFSRRVLEQMHGTTHRNVVTIPGGVDLEHFSPAIDRQSVRQQLGISPDQIVFLTVRDLEPRMGIDNFLRALASLSTKRKLGIIGGSGPLSDQLRKQVRQEGLENAVRFVGHIPEEQLPLYYQAADLFVLPTRAHEGFGLVTVEALACGTPVVATPVGATPEILVRLEPGLLSENTSAEAIAEAMRRALSFASTLEFRRHCRDYIERQYNWERHIDRFEAELLSVCLS